MDGILFRMHPNERTAQEWMGALTGTGDLYVNVLHLLGPDAETALDALGVGTLSPERIKRVVYSTISEATGRPWWEALRLASSVVSGDGRVLGNLYLSGVRPEVMSVSAYLCAVWAFLTRNADDKDLMKLESQLKALPPDADEDDFDLFDEGDDFGETVRQLQNAPGVSLG